MSLTTTLSTPHTVARTVTHRLTVAVEPQGRISFVGASGTDADGFADLAALPADGDGVSSVVAVLDTGDTATTGAVIVVPAGWHVNCRGEGGIFLGNVDFPFLGGSEYKPYPQTSRHSKIRTTISHKDGASTITLEVGATGELDGLTRQVYEVPAGTHYLVAFLGFTEQKVEPYIGQDESGNEVAKYKLVTMHSRGCTVKLSDSAGTELRAYSFE